MIARKGNGLHREGLVRETALIKQLFEDMDTAENQEALERLNALSYYQDLVAKEEEFEKCHTAKVEEESEKDLPRLLELRESLTSHLNALLVITGFLLETNPGIYESLEKQINEGAGEMLSNARARQTRNWPEDSPGS